MRTTRIGVWSRLTVLLFALLFSGCLMSGTKPPAGDGDYLQNYRDEQSQDVRNSRAAQGNGNAEQTTPANQSIALFKEGRQFSQEGDLYMAVSRYREALTIDPENYDCLYELAALLSQNEQTRGQAAELLRNLLRRLIALEPSSKTNLHIRRAQKMLREFDPSAVHLSDAADLLAGRAQEAESSDQFETAADLYVKAIEIWPGCALARQRLENLCKRFGWDRAMLPAAPKAGRPYLELSAVIPFFAHTNNDMIRFNTTKWNLPIYNNGKTYADGIWAPAPSRISFQIEGKFSKLKCLGLVSAYEAESGRTAVLEQRLRTPGAGIVQFVVIGDGVEIYRSDLVSYDTGAVVIDVDIIDVKILSLETHTGDGKDLMDFSVWASGRLYVR
ncbi:MAG: NPCBM/NEW2 domain-containing protein [Verrucomicrobia bacterium]|nr:NPCBM/NEW2 domain-containing protein [Verrucomicrobiota bacterium]